VDVSALVLLIADVAVEDSTVVNDDASEVIVDKKVEVDSSVVLPLVRIVVDWGVL